MSNQEVENAINPVHQLYKKFYRKTRNRIVMLTFLLMVVWIAGVPHLQWNYSFRGTRDKNGFVAADQKIEAWYVSVTGWKHVHVGDFGTHGLPVVFFIPLQDCIEQWFVNFPPVER